MKKSQSRASSPGPNYAPRSRQLSNRPAQAQRVDMLEFARSIPFPAECTLWELIEQRTGQEIPLEQFALWERQRENERHLQLRVARAMGKNGRAAAGTASDSISVVGLMTGYAEQLVKTPRRNCFAWVSRAQRKELLLNLTYYLAHRQGCRHIRLTQGPRVPLTEIGATFRSLARSVSRLNTREWFRDKAEVVLRCSELAWDGESAHVHAHLVVRPVGALSEADWIELEGHVRESCSGDVSDFEPIGDPGAAGPYLTKANDLAEMSGPELRTYAQELRHIRTHEPLGEFRAFCQELKKTNMKLTRIGRRIVRVHRSDGMRQVNPMERPFAQELGKQTTPPVNRLIRLGPPRPHGTNRSEPALLIQGYDGDLDHVLEENPDMRNLRDRLMPQWPRRPRQTLLPPSIVPSSTDNRPTAPSSGLRDQPAKSESSPSATSTYGASSVPPTRSVPSSSPMPASNERLAHPVSCHKARGQSNKGSNGGHSTDADDNADVASPSTPNSPFLRSEMDRFRRCLGEPPAPRRRRKPNRSLRAPAQSAKQPRTGKAVHVARLAATSS